MICLPGMSDNRCCCCSQAWLLLLLQTQQPINFTVVMPINVQVCHSSDEIGVRSLHMPGQQL
jgi:hypothetical protein